MKTIKLDVTNIQTVKALHIYLAWKMELPAYYGRNLDALHDMLTSIRTDTTLILQNFDSESPESDSFRLVLEDAAVDNPHLTLAFV